MTHYIRRVLCYAITVAYLDCFYLTLRLVTSGAIAAKLIYSQLGYTPLAPRGFLFEPTSHCPQLFAASWELLIYINQQKEDIQMLIQIQL